MHLIAPNALTNAKEFKVLANYLQRLKFCRRTCDKAGDDEG